MELMTFEVAVSSHELLSRGITEAEYRYVAVLAESYAEGQVLAAQMVYAREAMAKSQFDMVTAARPYL